MIVVSNTSPLTNLAKIQQFELLQKLYGQLHIATGVWEELNAFEKPWPGAQEVFDAAWITQHEVENQTLVTALKQDLDRGEAETIALALQLKADLVLLDEKSGRQHALRQGLSVGGVLGILIEAKHKQLIPTVKPELDKLVYEAGFFLKQNLYKKVLQLVSE